MPRETEKSDWRRLAKALRDRGVRPAQIRRTNDGFSVVTAEGRVGAPYDQLVSPETSGRKP